MGPWDGKGPPPRQTREVFPETGGAKDPKQREERNMVRTVHVRAIKLGVMPISRKTLKRRIK